MEETKESGTFTQITGGTRRAGGILLLTLGCFFMGRAQVFSSISPFVIAGASVGFLEGKGFYLLAIASLGGLATRFSIQHSVKYFIAIGIMWLINIIVTKKTDLLTKSVIIGAVTLLSALVLAIIRGLSAYALTVSILEGVLAASLSFIFIKGHTSLINLYRAKQETLSAEELTCASFLAGGIIMGAADIWAGPLSFRYILCVFLVLFILKAVGSFAVPAALLLGVLMNAAGFEGHGFTVALAVSALAATFVKTRNKFILSGIFTAVFAVLSLYFDIFALPLLLSATSSSLLFSLVPTRILADTGGFATPGGLAASEYYSRARAITSSRLKNASQAFAKLAASFGGARKPRTGLTMPEVRNLLDDVIAKSCVDCVKNYVCFEQNFYDTYQKAFEALKNCDIIPISEVETNPIMDFCIRREQFYGNIRYFFELYRNDLKWRNFLNESREMASTQLKAASSIVSELADDLNFSGTFDFEAEKKLRQSLAKKGVNIKRLSVAITKDGRCEAEIIHKSCGRGHQCAGLALIASEAIGRRMKKNEKECTYDKAAGGSCKLVLSEENRVKAAYGAAFLPHCPSGVSGDSYSFSTSKDGHITLILSDGMGKGKDAAAASSATIELFEDFVGAGFDKDAAARLINSALLLKDTDGSDIFSTLDAATINTHNGRAEFLKVGAAASFIVSTTDGRKEVETISSYSLPVGILGTVSPETLSRKISHGDIIIMMSDGVMDTAGISGTSQKEAWLLSAMNKLTSQNPKAVAEHLIDLASRGGEIKDDMTVLCARIVEGV